MKTPGIGVPVNSPKEEPSICQHQFCTWGGSSLQIHSCPLPWSCSHLTQVGQERDSSHEVVPKLHTCEPSRCTFLEPPGLGMVCYTAITEKEVLELKHIWSPYEKQNLFLPKNCPKQNPRGHK